MSDAAAAKAETCQVQKCFAVGAARPLQESCLQPRKDLQGVSGPAQLPSAWHRTWASHGLLS
jgi:hypothetical protein